MIVLLRATLISVALAVLVSRAEGQNITGYGTANEYYLGCKEYAGQQQPTNIQMTMLGNYCSGVVYALGSISQYLTVPEWKSCTPQNADNPQLARVVLKFLDDYPERMNEPLVRLTLEAFHRAWPCN
jgi:hypothetical protein